MVTDATSLYRHEPYRAIAKLKQNAQLPIARIFSEALSLLIKNQENERARMAIAEL